MAGNASTYLANAIAQAVANQKAFPAVSGLWMALFDTSGNEFTTTNYPNYARQQITPSTVGSSGTSFNNTNQIQFGQNSSGGTLTIGSVGCYDASTAGNQLYKETLGTNISLPNGQALQFPAGNVTFGES